jgi:REP element-mobilizing transposase RayT
MALWRLYYHFVWATKMRHPLITGDIEPELYGYIIGKATTLGCIIHAVGGMPDHIHIVASVPPKMAVADFVGHIKGSSSYHLNHWPGAVLPEFGWQRGYGVFSLGKKQLGSAVAYVLRQKEHHRHGTTIPILECDSDEDDAPEKYYAGQDGV